MDDAGDGRLLARTVLHRSSEAEWQQALPLALGTVDLTSGAHLICFLAADVQPGEPVRVKAGPDPLGRQSLTAHRI
ncbi:OB-fold domain-containing protein [Sphingomonas sp. SRS2]|uniref:OB-fold domain-containing protein n=1 Tax=Sphingomonas sp. SRS2 TaxID=133190 RepID=UPI001F2EED7B|nr:OB-fold domain-containing protein [Sphingomonas sp. SRS2]